MSELNKLFGQRLKQAMLDKGFKSMPETDTGVEVRPFARALNMSHPLIRRYLLGQAMPRPDALEIICKYLNVSVLWLRDGIEEPSQVIHVPLLSWEEALHWKSGRAYPHKINLSLSMAYSSSIFALKITDTRYKPGFTAGTLLFFDTAKKPSSSAYVLVAEKGNPKATFKHLLIDQKDFYLRPPSFELPPKLMPKGTKILGVLIGVDYSKAKM